MRKVGKEDAAAVLRGEAGELGRRVVEADAPRGEFRRHRRQVGLGHAAAVAGVAEAEEAQELGVALDVEEDAPKAALRYAAVRVDARLGPVGAAAETSESVGWQNFGKMLLVFGCIGSDFCKKICVLQHFSKSTRFSS